MKPTTRLLLVVVAISLAIALSVAGLALGLSWVSDMQIQSDALRRELDLVMSAVQSFSVTQAQAQEVYAKSEWVTEGEERENQGFLPESLGFQEQRPRKRDAT